MSKVQNSYQMDVIGIIHSPYQEKFCIPRQPILNKVVKAKLELLAPYNCEQAIQGLDEVSHLWIEFIFHQIPEDNTKLMVRPPRLGGNKKKGVLATRSPFRKNRLGLSVVKLDEVVKEKGKYFIVFTGVDMLDKTPVIDIKPYVPYADSIEDAQLDYVTLNPQKTFSVGFEDSVKETLKKLDNLEQELQSILRFDPCPAYINVNNNIFKFKFQNCDIVCKKYGKAIIIIDIIV